MPSSRSTSCRGETTTTEARRPALPELERPLADRPHATAGASRVLDEPSAIVHDWFQGMHGAERVVDTLRTGLFRDGSEVDILTFTAARGVVPPELGDRIVRESRLARLPGLRQDDRHTGRWRYLLPYMPRYF